MTEKPRADLTSNDNRPPAVHAAQWGARPVQEAARHFGTDLRTGLSDEVAEKRLDEFGHNEVKAGPQQSPLAILIHQFLSSVVVLLLIAATISFLTGELLQGIGILAAVFINAAVGFFTEFKAKISLEALEKISGPVARVVRGGRDIAVPASNLVPGDLVILEAGNRIPAELRIVECASLTIDESVLTGESVPVYKSDNYIEGEDAASTIAFHGTFTVKGRATGLVVATGENTRLGQLQCLLTSTPKAETPMEKRLEVLGRQLSILTVVICVALAIVGIFHKQNIWHMLETSIALAVAAIPEGLPVVATLALAVGTQRMVKLGVLIRELSAVETLGCTTVICSDKTGTLTENQMLATDIILNRRHLTLSGTGYDPSGSILENEQNVLAKDDELLKEMLTAAVLCNDASIEKKDGTAEWITHGDPTEGALIAAGAKGGVSQKELNREFPRVAERPFDLARKLMTTIHKCGDDNAIAYIKGSPEQIIALSNSQLTGSSSGAISPLTEDEKAWYLEENHKLAKQGLRVLGFAMKDCGNDLECNRQDNVEEALVFLGLIAMRDLPRKGVKQALKKCHAAGVQVIMLTGDQPATARTIAQELHIATKDASEDQVILGQDLESMSDERTIEALEAATVLARVTPPMKLKIVQALQKKGEVVAMTGDGVNDAPALRQSNIGVAMGLSGTDLAREASNMVITDDNFSTIVTAIEQGRIIYENIKRSICYLLTATIASLFTISLAIAVNDPLPLTPLQLLWLNLIMHVFPALGIVLQPASSDLMQHPPRNPKENILERNEFVEIFMRGIAVSLAVLAALQINSRFDLGVANITSLCFVTISLALLYQAWAWLGIGGRGGVRPNLLMYVMMVISYGLIFMALYIPPLAMALETAPLSASGWAVAFAVSTVSVALTEITSTLLKRSAMDETAKEGRAK